MAGKATCRSSACYLGDSFEDSTGAGVVTFVYDGGGGAETARRLKATKRLDILFGLYQCKPVANTNL